MLGSSGGDPVLSDHFQNMSSQVFQRQAASKHTVTVPALLSLRLLSSQSILCRLSQQVSLQNNMVDEAVIVRTVLSRVVVWDCLSILSLIITQQPPGPRSEWIYLCQTR